MDIRQLQYIVALSQRKAFHAGCEGMPRHTAHAFGRIRQLEQELGVPIVERGQRFHGFTPEGDRVLTWANAILDNWDEPIETNSVINLCANVRLSGLASVIPEYFLDVLGPISDVRAVPLSSPIVEHSVGLIAVDRDPISPLVLAAFECARAIDRRL